MMKRQFHTISANELDVIVREAGMEAAADSIARRLPLTGMIDGKVVTLLPDDPLMDLLAQSINANRKQPPDEE